MWAAEGYAAADPPEVPWAVTTDQRQDQIVPVTACLILHW